MAIAVWKIDYVILVSTLQNFLLFVFSYFSLNGIYFILLRANVKKNNSTFFTFQFQMLITIEFLMFEYYKWMTNIVLKVLIRIKNSSILSNYFGNKACYRFSDSQMEIKKILKNNSFSGKYIKFSIHLKTFWVFHIMKWHKFPKVRRQDSNLIQS